MNLKQIDVNTAYLEGEIDEEFFVPQSLGFEVLKDGESLVPKLLKLLYRLKQYGRKRFFTLGDFLTSIGSKSDRCFF